MRVSPGLLLIVLIWLIFSNIKLIYGVEAKNQLVILPEERPMSITASVRYKYRREGSAGWTSTTLTLHINQQSETLVMQKLRDKHRGCEIELVKIEWK